MKAAKPLIFISNDDGFRAKGICHLIEILRPMAELVVVAPDSGRSGAGCSITSQKPVRIDRLNSEEGLTVFSCTGTPMDCVKLGMEQAVPRTPDLVIGGINHGDNSAVNAFYSGTMGIAIEGCLKKIPSVAFSLCSFDKDADFSGCSEYILRIVKAVLKNELPAGTCLNVNFPSPEMIPYKGIRFCRQDKGHWESEWCADNHPGGLDYFWLTGKYVNDEPFSTDTDQWALANGYVAVTPTQIDLTAYQLLADLPYWDLNDEVK